MVLMGSILLRIWPVFPFLNWIMREAKSKIIRSYVFREILGATLLSTLVLTAILLYGNLSKNDDELFRALAISPLFFLELVSLMLPFALSLGLPFGFSLAVIFCVGRWSANREVLAMQSLGINRKLWAKPIFLSALAVSFVGCFASLQLSPVSRGVFEERVREMIWQDFESWVEDSREIAFKVDGGDDQNFMGGLSSGHQEKMTRVTMSIGYGLGSLWHNVRILTWGTEDELLAVLHAKRANVSKIEKKGVIELSLLEVDYESIATTEGKGIKSSNFVSFQKWKQPIRFSLESAQINRDAKRMSLIELFDRLKKGTIYEGDVQRACYHFNKYASLGCAPLALSPLLISFAVRRGRKETYANLFTGILICLFYFLLGTSIGELVGSNGYGWWFSNILIGGSGVMMLAKQNI
jgi:lipopolysaccharide export LptBFGC system permease protein LptF